MKPFKLFFGLAIALVVFFFIARVMLIAFVVAAVMSIAYAIYRRIKDFISYDRYGNPYVGSQASQRMSFDFANEVEPLFQERATHRHPKVSDVHYVDVI